MRKLQISIAVLALITSHSVLAQKNSAIVHAGFCTGNDYIHWTKAEKSSYAAGFVNGVLMAPVFGAPSDKTKWFEDYIAHMTDEQVAGIITQYVNDNPGEWHVSLNILSYRAIKKAYEKAYPSADKEKKYD
jgi:hypothetical protein